MAGKWCNGTDETGTLKESKAYCEGRKAFVDGAAIGTNPHPAGSDDAVAWDHGHNDANPAVDNVPASETCCAE